jgi:hypothetical protein
VYLLLHNEVSPERVTVSVSGRGMEGVGEVLKFESAKVRKLKRISNIQHGMINVHGEGLLRRAGVVRKLERKGGSLFYACASNSVECCLLDNYFQGPSFGHFSKNVSDFPAARSGGTRKELIFLTTSLNFNSSGILA